MVFLATQQRVRFFSANNTCVKDLVIWYNKATSKNPRKKKLKKEKKTLMMLCTTSDNSIHKVLRH